MRVFIGDKSYATDENVIVTFLSSGRTVYKADDIEFLYLNKDDVSVIEFSIPK